MKLSLQEGNGHPSAIMTILLVPDTNEDEAPSCPVSLSESLSV